MIKRIPGVKYVVAPYEADAQLGFLARNGHVDAVITEDSDILLFGCTRVMFKLDRDGTGQEIDLQEVFSRRLEFIHRMEYCITVRGDRPRCPRHTWCTYLDTRSSSQSVSAMWVPVKCHRILLMALIRHDAPPWDVLLCLYFRDI